MSTGPWHRRSVTVVVTVDVVTVVDVVVVVVVVEDVVVVVVDVLDVAVVVVAVVVVAVIEVTVVVVAVVVVVVVRVVVVVHCGNVGGSGTPSHVVSRCFVQTILSWPHSPPHHVAGVDRVGSQLCPCPAGHSAHLPADAIKRLRKGSMYFSKAAGTSRYLW